MTYPPPRPVQPPQPDVPPNPNRPPESRIRAVVHRLRFVLVLLAVPIPFVFVVVALIGSWTRPEVGECVIDVDEHLWGYNTVACDDPDAAYLVVVAEHDAYGYSRGPCDDFPDGVAYVEEQHRGSTVDPWGMCATPLE